MRIAFVAVEQFGQRWSRAHCPGASGWSDDAAVADVVTFGLRARDCAERRRRGDRIGLTGRLEQDDYRTDEEKQITCAVLIDQLDVLSDRRDSLSQWGLVALTPS